MLDRPEGEVARAPPAADLDVGALVRPVRHVVVGQVRDAHQQVAQARVRRRRLGLEPGDLVLLVGDERAQPLELGRRRPSPSPRRPPCSRRSARRAPPRRRRCGRGGSRRARAPRARPAAAPAAPARRRRRGALRGSGGCRAFSGLGGLSRAGLWPRSRARASLPARGEGKGRIATPTRSVRDGCRPRHGASFPDAADAREWPKPVRGGHAGDGGGTGGGAGRRRRPGRRGDERAPEPRRHPAPRARARPHRRALAHRALGLARRQRPGLARPLPGPRRSPAIPKPSPRRKPSPTTSSPTPRQFGAPIRCGVEVHRGPPQRRAARASASRPRPA